MHLNQVRLKSNFWGEVLTVKDKAENVRGSCEYTT